MKSLTGCPTRASFDSSNVFSKEETSAYISQLKPPKAVSNSKNLPPKRP